MGRGDSTKPPEAASVHGVVSPFLAPYPRGAVPAALPPYSTRLSLQIKRVPTLGVSFFSASAQGEAKDTIHPVGLARMSRHLASYLQRKTAKAEHHNGGPFPPLGDTLAPSSPCQAAEG